MTRLQKKKKNKKKRRRRRKERGRFFRRESVLKLSTWFTRAATNRPTTPDAGTPRAHAHSTRTLFPDGPFPPPFPSRASPRFSHLRSSLFCSFSLLTREIGWIIRGYSADTDSVEIVTEMVVRKQEKEGEEKMGEREEDLPEFRGKGREGGVIRRIP